MRLVGVLALVVVGGFIGWLAAASAAPSNTELRKAASELVPSRAWLDSIELVDHSSPFGGSRYAEAVLNPPAKVDEEALQQAVAERLGPTDWSRTGTSSGGGPVYRRANLEATVETTAFEPGIGLEATIRIRPRSWRTGVAAAIGGLCGLFVGLGLGYMLDRRRRVGADAA